MQLDNISSFLGKPGRVARASCAHSARSLVPLLVTLLLAPCVGVSVGHAEESPPFVPHPGLTFKDLVESIRHSPSIAAAKRELEMRKASLAQSVLWSNPVVDATWSTIPIGRTNPAGLEQPLAKIPSYHVGISYTFPLGKRGPLREARAEDVRAAQAQRCATGRQLALELAVSLGNMATAQLRIEALRQLVEAAKEQERLVEARLGMQLASGLELDRSVIERGRFEQQLSGAESDLSEQQASCSFSTGTNCQTFRGASEARNYLEKWINVQPEALLGHVLRTERPEVRALAHAEFSARHQETYFSRQTIPDPTVRLGYVHDQFWTSGAQPNSLELSVAFPLPLLDHGQAGVRSARAAANGYAEERAAMNRARVAVIPALYERLQAQRQRRKKLLEALIPRARAAVSDVAHAYDTRLLSVNDVIQARRALLDLLLEEVDGLADAYQAVLGLRSQIAESGDEGCPQ